MLVILIRRRGKAPYMYIKNIELYKGKEEEGGADLFRVLKCVRVRGKAQSVLCQVQNICT